jgi:hypothetical protein
MRSCRNDHVRVPLPDRALVLFSGEPHRRSAWSCAMHPCSRLCTVIFAVCQGISAANSPSTWVVMASSQTHSN